MNLNPTPHRDLPSDTTELSEKNLREQFEAREQRFISPFGCLSSKARRKVNDTTPCVVRTAFQQDRDRIVYSNAFRRLKYKTQVFLNPLGDAYRTRLSHTLEVAQIARTIARAMFLNEDLAEAIALGHDLGHTPFGHGGEIALKEIYSPHFTHNRQSLRVVDCLENNGRGLNLTLEVLDGIRKHSKGFGQVMPENPAELPITAEGRIVRFADIMAYLNHDLDDAIRSGVIESHQVPETCLRILGHSHSERAIRMIRDLIASSRATKDGLVLQMSAPINEAMQALRHFLYENVYRSERVHREFVKAKKILSDLYAHFLGNDADLHKELRTLEMHGCHSHAPQRERLVCDLLASMTDRYAMNLYRRIFFPSPTV
ncbi:MAG: deoxyguanosinetriphosphate triphosphohydrolase [Desulfobacterales bacterium]|jgi:dGTPase